MRSPILNRLALGALIAWSLLPLPASARKPQANDSDFVSIQSVDRTITIDLRYAGSNNVTRHAIYPSGISAMARASVAQRLAIAQKYLKTKGYGLKIWDAYRPAATQQQLWHATHNRSFVADPTGGIGSMHTRGAAVDATLVDSSGREVAMPTDYDNFTPAALIAYEGTDPVVRSNLKLLQKAMAHAGFYGLRTEWWHFCAPDWKKYPQVPELKTEPEKKRWFW
ncbi:MAG: zinc D-Ala-D-Ala dipeptidase [Verrucomicrobiota bacterium]